MTSRSVLPGYGETGVGARQSRSFPITTQHVQEHLAPPPRRTLRSSSSESLITERLWQDHLTDPSQWCHKKRSRDVDFNHRISEQSVWINGWDDPGSLKGLEDMVSESKAGMDISSSTACSDHALPNSTEPSVVEDVQESNTKVSPRSTRPIRSAKRGCKPGHHHLLRVQWEAQTIEETLGSLERMPDEPLPTEIFIPVLKKCRKQKDLAHAKRLHLHMCNHGFEAHGVLENFLVTIFVDSGCVLEAQQLVNRLALVDEHSWNTLIQGYIECGESEQAFKLYRKMQEQFVSPRRYILMALLKTFASLQCLEEGQELHVKIVKEGLERDRFFCNTLVDMYMKCDSLTEAQEVFNEQPFKDVVLWSTLISGYTELGLFKNVLRCWDLMLSEGVVPDAPTYVCSLRACASVGDLDRGRKIHTAIVKQMPERDLILGKALMDMYAKCGSLADFQEVFDKMPVRDVVLWTSLIAGYADRELGEEALRQLDRMQQAGVTPNDVSFLCGLKACGSIGAIDKGQHIHAEIVKEEYERYPFVSNALVDMYCKCGSFVEARFIFDKLPIQNVISWTALIAGYAEHGLSKKALQCLKRMQQQGVLPNTVTFLCALKACCSVGAIGRGRELHAEIAKKGFERDLLVSSTLMGMYAKCGSPPEAQLMFDRLPTRNIVSWTALITGYAKYGHGEEALDCFKQMQGEGVSPEAVTYVYSLKACGDIGAIDKGQSIHAEIMSKGFEKSYYVGTALVDMYAKNGSLAEARVVFDSLQARDTALWNMLIDVFSEHGLCEQVLSDLKQMQLEGVSPDVSTWVCCTKACQDTGFRDRARELHLQIVKQGFEIDPSIGRALLDMYAMHSSFADAWDVFDKLPARDSKSWSAIIARIC